MKVLLKHNFATPFGRFRQSRDGVPTEIPDIVVKRLAAREEAILRQNAREKGEEYKAPSHTLGLPMNAVVVGADYKTPAQRMAEEGVDSVAMTAAEIEEQILAKAEERAKQIVAEQQAAANAKTAKSAEKAANKEVDDENKEDEDNSTKDAVDLDALLAKSIPDIVPFLSDLEYEPLKALLAKEQEGRNRATLVVQIEAALDEFE